MTPSESLTSLRQFLDEPSTLTVVLAATAPNHSIDFRRLNLSDEIASRFRDIAREALANLSDLILRPYDPGYKPDAHELTYIEASSNDRLAAIVGAFSQIANLPLFNEDDRYMRKLRFYSIALESSDGRSAVLFRHTTTKFEVNRRGLALVFAGGTYTGIANRALLFDREIDSVAWDGYLFMTAVSQFERTFGYLDQLQQRADQGITEFVQLVPIANEADFRAAVKGQLQMVSKVARIAGRPYLTSLTMQQVKSIITAFALDIDTEVDEQTGQEKLVFSQDPRKRWNILKLLDDDFLSSQMTNLRYEVNSKSPV